MKKILVLATLAMLGFGGFIGYSTNYVETATAKEITIPRYVDIPRTNGFNLDINLNNGTVACNSQEQNIDVRIERKDSIIYRTRVVTKEITKHVKVKEVPPLRKPKPTVLGLCKAEPNLHRIVD